MKTIEINVRGQKKKYAPVNERIKAFTADHPKGHFQKSYAVHGDYVIFYAEVFDPEDKELYADGHGCGKLSDAKGLEKAETVAVGRALGFLGYGADGDIATAEEMQDYVEQTTVTESQERLERGQMKCRQLLGNIGGLADEEERELRRQIGSANLAEIIAIYKDLEELAESSQVAPSAKQRNQKVKDKLEDPKA